MHGLNTQLIEWPEDLINLFVAEGFRVIRFDNRDIGLSTQGTWTPPRTAKTLAAILARRPLKGVGYTLVDMADDAAGLLDALDIESAHIVGRLDGWNDCTGVGDQPSDPGCAACVRSCQTWVTARVAASSCHLRARSLGRPTPTKENAVDEDVKLNELISGPHFDAGERRTLAAALVERSFTPGRYRTAVGCDFCEPRPHRTARNGDSTDTCHSRTS